MTGIPGGARRATATAGALLLLAAGMTGCTRDAAGAATVLRTDGGTRVVLAGGRVVDGRDGMQVPRDAVVRAGRTGASLVTRGREVLLGADTEVAVLDGERQQLRRGSLLVVTDDAPGVEVDAGAASADVGPDRLVRLERGLLLRVGVYRGAPLRVRAAGRRASAAVPALHQVLVPSGALPGRPTPLALTGDRWEVERARDLVERDADLRRLARGIDAPAGAGAAVLAAVPASVTATAPAVSGSPRSETALGYAVADAARRGGSATPQRFATVRGLRADGGSWGVVAALLDAGTDRVGRVLEALLAGDGGGPSVAVGAAGPGGGPGAGPDAPGSPDGGSTPRPTPRPTAPPTSPPPSPEPDPVEQVVETLASLLPTPPPGTPRPLLPLRPLLREVAR